MPFIPVPGLPPEVIAVRLVQDDTVCAKCNRPIKPKPMSDAAGGDVLEYRWEGREYDCFCLTNILGDCVSDPAKWLRTALVGGCATDWLGTSALWEAARGASGDAPDGTAWGFRRRQFIPFARQLLNLVPARVTRTGTAMKNQNGWRGWQLATDAERQTRVAKLAGEWESVEAIYRAVLKPDIGGVIQALHDDLRRQPFPPGPREMVANAYSGGIRLESRVK